MSRDSLQSTAIIVMLMTTMAGAYVNYQMRCDIVSIKELVIDTLYKVDRLHELRKTISICGEVILPEEP